MVVIESSGERIYEMQGKKQKAAIHLYNNASARKVFITDDFKQGNTKIIVGHIIIS